MRRMRIAILIALLATSSLGGYWAANRLVPKKVPLPTGLTVVGDGDVVIDRKDRSTPLEYVFRLHNPTSQRIVIDRVQYSCACIASELGSSEVAPGATIPLSITIKVFDAYKPSYRETIWLETSAGPLELSISGRLPLPDNVVFRPTVIYLDPIPNVAITEREVQIRVPKQCCRNLSREDVSWSGVSQVVVQLTEQAPSDLYREFTLRVSVPSEHAGAAAGEIQFDSGCGPVRVEVKTTPRRLP